MTKKSVSLVTVQRPHYKSHYYWNIIESIGLDKKVCDRYCTMGFME